MGALVMIYDSNFTVTVVFILLSYFFSMAKIKTKCATLKKKKFTRPPLRKKKYLKENWCAKKC